MNNAHPGEKHEVPRRGPHPSITAYSSGLFLGLLVVVLLAAATIDLMSLGVGERTLIDTDGYMRVVRVQELATGEVGWLDGTVYRSNAPHGHATHWTRPMDLVILVAGIPLMPLLGVPDAIYWGGVIAGPLLLIAIAVSIAWAAQHLVGRHMAWLAGLVAALQPAVFTYARAGRADHHALILVAFVLMIGAAIRMSTPPGRTSWSIPLVGGLSAAFSLWVAAESLIWITLLVVFGFLAWAISRVWSANQQRRWWTTFAIAVAFFAFLDHGVNLVGHVEFDQISTPHIAFGALVAAVWTAATLVEHRVSSRHALTAVVAAVAGIAALAMYTTLPKFFGGPLVNVPDDLMVRWNREVSEYQPLLESFGTFGLLFVAIPLVGLFASAIIAVRSRSGDRAPWLLLSTVIAAGLIATFEFARFAAFPEALAAIPVAYTAGRIIESVQTGSAMVRMPTTVAVVVVATTGYLALLLLPPGSPANTGASAPDGSCDRSAASLLVNSVEAARPVILADVFVGPELLFRTNADVVSTPHHRNDEGIRDTLDAYEGEPSVAALPIIMRRGVTHVLFCEAEASPESMAGTESLATRLANGDPPAFLRRVAGPKGGFTLYEVALP